MIRSLNFGLMAAILAARGFDRAERPALSVPRVMDQHVHAWRNWRIEERRRLEAAALAAAKREQVAAQRERDKVWVEAAEAKRLRRREKAMKEKRP